MDREGDADERETSADRRASDGGQSTDSRESESGQSTVLSRPAVDDASGLGLSMTLVTGVLFALAYYGVVSVDEFGFGEAAPEPFYLLALALLFVVELARSDSYDARGLASVVATTAVYGVLVILAIEGSVYLWERPDAALDDYEGVTVLAVSLVVAALVYVLSLSVTESTRKAS